MSYKLGEAPALATTTNPVVVSTATAPNPGDVLTASGATAAGWQPAAGGGAEIFAKRGASVITIGPVGSGGGTATSNVTTWFNEGIIIRIRLVASANTVQTTLEFYAKDTFMAADLLYQATNVDAWNNAYIDLVPDYYTDDDVSAELHVKITNNGANPASYDLEVVGLGQ